MYATDIQELARKCLTNSKRWFPTVHRSTRNAMNHCVLGLAGEAGETANKWKKFIGYTDHNSGVTADDIKEELVDTLIYVLVLLEMFKVNIPTAVDDKIAICETRWDSK